MPTLITRGLLATTLACLILAGPAAAQNDDLDADIAFARRLSHVFQHVSNQIEPSVVHIRTAARQRIIERDVFGRRLGVREGPLAPSGLGSGVIVSEDGYIITNNHVVEAADALTVGLSDGREVEARIVGADPATDVAVLKIDASGLTPARFGDSETLEVGEWVIAVGSPFGFSKSVTTGIVSAKGRSGLSGSETNRYEEFIQTDASINPGNSGGPLVNLEGEVVGINTAILSSRVGGSIGIGFAIPSRMAEAVYRTIVRTGRVERGWLGIMMEDVGGPAAGAPNGAGVLVTEVVPGSPADRAGLRTGDIITAFDGARTENANRLRNAIAFTAPGADVEITLLRDGETRRLQTEIVDSVEGRAVSVGATYLRDLGLSLIPLDPALAREIGLDSDARGLLVYEVVEGAPARQSGLVRGDIIFAAGRVETDSPPDLIGAIERAGPAVDLTVQRGARTGRLTLRLAQ
ncbi:MAG: trypsin-like peptidase domain-containing protein [Phycisphaerales bacterium JB039]